MDEFRLAIVILSYGSADTRDLTRELLSAAFPVAPATENSILKTAADLSARGFTHMLTLEAGGPDYGSEVHKLVRASMARPHAIILGRHKTPTPFWTRLLYDQAHSVLRDPSSSFRIYPLSVLQGFSLNESRDFNLEILARLMWNNVGVQEVDVDCEKRIAPSYRFSWWRPILFTVSVLKSRFSAREAAVASAAGVFIGCTPFFGLHLALVIGVSLIFRLNIIFVFLASHISNPVLAPFVIASSVYVGRHWLGIATAGGHMANLYQWLAGSAIVGSGLALLTGIAVYWIAKRD